MKIIFAALLGQILFSSMAFAWFAEGHEIVAIIAADVLTPTARSPRGTNSERACGHRFRSTLALLTRFELLAPSYHYPTSKRLQMRSDGGDAVPLPAYIPSVVIGSRLPHSELLAPRESD
jgi:hypothetical protein